MTRATTPVRRLTNHQVVVAIILGDESGDIFDDEDALMEDLDAILMGRSVKVTKPASAPRARRNRGRRNRKRDA